MRKAKEQRVNNSGFYNIQRTCAEQTVLSQGDRLRGPRGTHCEQTGAVLVVHARRSLTPEPGGGGRTGRFPGFSRRVAGSWFPSAPLVPIHAGAASLHSSRPDGLTVDGARRLSRHDHSVHIPAEVRPNALAATHVLHVTKSM